MNSINLAQRGIQQNTVETVKIQSILDEATAAGGLTVVIPQGVYMAGTLNLGSASLYLEKGAVLKASPNLADYRDNGFVHNEMRQTVSFLYSMSHANLSIYGEGTIDLSGDSFYDMDTPNIPDYGVPFSEAQKAECPRAITHRPTQPIFFYDCRHVTVRDVRIVNAPCWTMAFHACEDVRVMDVIIDNNLAIPNNDGMHFCGSRNVIIRGCNISAGDDCIALTGITDWDRPCENVVISDCLLRSVSKAISLGYMHSIVRNVCISNCIIYDSQRGLCIMASKDTGLVEHVMVNNLRIDTHVRAGNWWGNGEAIEILGLYHNYEGYLFPIPAPRFKVNVRDIQLQSITCTSENVIALVGDDNLEDIALRNVYFEKKPSMNRYLKGDRRIDVSPSSADVQVPADGEYWLYVTGCEGLTVEQAVVKPFQGQPLKRMILR